MIRDVLEQSLRDALAAVGVDAPASCISNARRAASTATGRRTWRWPPPRPPAATRELATALVEWLNAHPPTHVERVELAGPGFVNFHLRPRGCTTC